MSEDITFYSLAVNCGPLTGPNNGMVTVSDTTFMSTATYSCNPGYILMGSVTRTCEAVGNWYPLNATCERKSTKDTACT